ncbi:MAG TPA: SPOR domain-containing protein [Desulfuromonadales bacterium]|nr:SPOR domain-containing protein [Desulfuromonadales bacterium]
MAQPMLSRSQRRMEKKQAGLIVVLVFLVAVVSFVLGVMAGQKGFSLPGFGTADVREIRLPTATEVVPVPEPPPQDTGTEASQLTFYDNLPKGDQAPLGSGINLPAETPAQAGSETAASTKPPPVNLAQTPAPAAKPQPSAPAASPQGEFLVQVASFKTSQDAEKLQMRLEKLGLDTKWQRADLGDKGVWYRVVAGPYAERAAADRVVVLLKEKERLSALVRKR